MLDHLDHHRHRHLTHAVRVHDPRALAASVHGINAKVAVIVTDLLGSMVCFWSFCVLALCSLPAVLTTFDQQVLNNALGLATFFPSVILKASVISLVAWLAQTFIQLTALSILQVSNNAQGRQQAHDTATLLADAETTREHTAQIIDALDIKTEGGLKEVLDAVIALTKTASGP